MEDCQTIENKIQGLEDDITALEDLLAGATDPEKQDILRQIGGLEREAARLEAALRRCRQGRADSYVVQGLLGNKLVAGKRSAMRMFNNLDLVASVAKVALSIQGPDGSSVPRTYTADATAWDSKIFVVAQSSRGPGLVVLFPGALVMQEGDYSITATLFDRSGNQLASHIAEPTYTASSPLRVLVSRIFSSLPLDNLEVFAAHNAMRRFVEILPVADGWSPLGGDPAAGLRYDVTSNPYPNDADLGVLYDQYLANTVPNSEVPNVGIAYRFPDHTIGEGSGGNGPHFWKQFPYSVIVWGPPLVHVFAHETGHCFGLEPKGDPHSDPSDPSHSKSQTIDVLDADLGFDIDLRFLAPFPNPTFDIMFPSGPDPEPPDNRHAYNSWDWNFLLRQIGKLPNSGTKAALRTLAPIGQSYLHHRTDNFPNP
jgi:hypothetical protein